MGINERNALWLNIFENDSFRLFELQSLNCKKDDKKEPKIQL